jgi:hypothetical protein
MLNPEFGHTRWGDITADWFVLPVRTNWRLAPSDILLIKVGIGETP